MSGAPSVQAAIAFPPTQPLAFWEPEQDDTLICRQVRDETHDVRSFLFESPSRTLFAFRPGQFLTFTFALAGGPVSRCYTIASAPTRPHAVSITVKRVAGGPVSNWLHDHLRPGMRVQAVGPLGDFTCDGQPPRPLLLLSAGSGITPMMAMARAHDDLGSDADILFVHSARSPDDIVFRDELALLERHRPGFRAVFVCGTDRPHARWPGHRGRLDAAMLAAIAPDLHERDAYVCGPAGYRAAVATMLERTGFDTSRLFQESYDFGELQQDDPAVAEASALLSGDTGYSISFARSGRRIACDAGGFILDAARRQGLRLPSACTKGICGTCKTRKLSGTVEMIHAGGIRQREIDAGLVLICCARPTSDVVLDC